MGLIVLVWKVAPLEQLPRVTSEHESPPNVSTRSVCPSCFFRGGDRGGFEWKPICDNIKMLSAFK